MAAPISEDLFARLLQATRQIVEIRSNELSLVRNLANYYAEARQELPWREHEPTQRSNSIDSAVVRSILALSYPEKALFDLRLRVAAAQARQARIRSAAQAKRSAGGGSSGNPRGGGKSGTKRRR